MSFRFAEQTFSEFGVFNEHFLSFLLGDGDDKSLPFKLCQLHFVFKRNRLKLLCAKMSSTVAPFILDCIRNGDTREVYTWLAQIEAITPGSGYIGLVINDTQHIYVNCLFDENMAQSSVTLKKKRHM